VHFNGLNKWSFLAGLSGPCAPSLLWILLRVNEGACNDYQEARACVSLDAKRGKSVHWTSYSGKEVNSLKESSLQFDTEEFLPSLVRE